LLARPEESSLIFLAFIVPLAIYCLVLSVINRRRHPVVVPGPWDFAGVLFAASGVLLIGGPAILTGVYEQWRLTWLLGQTHFLKEISDNWSFWISIWLLYFAVIASGSALMLWRRRRLTSIYNIEPAVFAEVLNQVLDRLELEWLRNGPRRLLLRLREPPLEAGSTALDPMLIPHRSQGAATPVLADPAQPLPQRTATSTPEVSTSAHPWAELVLEPFPAMCHVTLHWLGQDEAVRLEVETELAQALAQVRTRPNPVSAWFLSLSLGLFFSAFLVLFVLLALRILQLPR
jgi:hypothetical protein